MQLTAKRKSMPNDNNIQSYFPVYRPKKHNSFDNNAMSRFKKTQLEKFAPPAYFKKMSSNQTYRQKKDDRKYRINSEEKIDKNAIKKKRENVSLQKYLKATNSIEKYSNIILFKAPFKRGMFSYKKDCSSPKKKKLKLKNPKKNTFAKKFINIKSHKNANNNELNINNISTIDPKNNCSIHHMNSMSTINIEENDNKAKNLIKNKNKLNNELLLPIKKNFFNDCNLINITEIKYLNFLVTPRILLLAENNNKGERCVFSLVPNKNCYINGKDSFSFQWKNIKKLTEVKSFDLINLKNCILDENENSKFRMSFEENGSNIKEKIIDTFSQDLAKNYVESLNYCLRMVNDE